MEGDVYKIQIGEHTYTTPPEPAHKEILFWNKKKADQYWVRPTDLPQIFYDWWIDEKTDKGVELDAPRTSYENKLLVELSKEDTSLLFDKYDECGVEGLQEREMRRRTQGVWFYNNGVPTYLTGNHYFALAWGAMLGCDNTTEPGSSYGQYYRFQRDVCYYFEICKVVSYARGGVLIKAKKTGLTQLFSLICLNEAATHREKNVRMMSITESLCKESNFGLIVYALQKMPQILIPSRSKQNEGEVKFGPANSSRNPLKLRKESNTNPLYTWLCTVATGRVSFDSYSNHIAFIDEWPKIKDSTYPKELFEATIVTVIVGFVRVGTIFALSYVPEQSDRSFYEAKDIYYQSKLKTIEKGDDGKLVGETASKLICHTLPVQDGLFNCCDIYGSPIPEKIWGHIKDLIKGAKGDPEKIQAIKRQTPTSEADAWSESNMSGTLFDNIRLEQQLEELEEQYSIGNPPYVEFNLSFNEPVKKLSGTYYEFDLSVKYEEITHKQRMNGEGGIFKWFDKHLTPDWFMDKYKGGVTVDKKSGLLMPNPESPFFLSVDPTNFRQKKYTKVGSLNAMYAFIMPHAELNGYLASQIGEGAGATYFRAFIEYLYRQEAPRETLNDIIKLMLYLGCMIQIEGNIPTWPEAIIEMGLGKFLLMVGKDGALEPWTGRDDQSFFSSQKNTIPQYIKVGQDRLSAPIRSGDVDVIKYIKSRDLIKQLQRIKAEDTQEYDAAVAYLEGQMGMASLMGWRRAQDELKKKRGNGMIGAAALGLMR